MNKIILLLFMSICIQSSAELKVAVTEFEPLIIKDASKYSGFEIELWDMIATDLNLKYHIVDTNLKSIIDGVENNKYDVGIAGITINHEREERVNFSHPTYQSGLKIAVRSDNTTSYSLFEFKHIRSLFDSIWQPAVIEVGLALVIMLLIFAHIIWYCERGTNHLDGISINDNYFIGIWQALYFCNVTSSTVGYGDIVARKWLGKLSSIFLIYAGVVFFANFTALLSADYAVDKINHSITSLEDLKDKKVSTVIDTVSYKTLNSIGAKISESNNYKDAFKMLQNGEVDAFVFDAPVIDNLVLNSTDIIGLPELYNKQYYAFISNNIDLNEKINKSLMKIYENGMYDKLYNKFFGIR